MSAVEPRQLAAAVQQELAAAAQGAAQRMKSAVTAAGAEGARTVQTLSPRRTQPNANSSSPLKASAAIKSISRISASRCTILDAPRAFWAYSSIP